MTPMMNEQVGADGVDADNILLRGLGPISTRSEAIATMMELPTMPRRIGDMPRESRLLHLMSLRDFHVPSREQVRLHETINLMVRQGYRYRNPASSNVWGNISGEARRGKMPRAPAFGSAVEGLSGTGKTEACLRCLNLFPSQVFVHDKFPRLVGSSQQVVWLSVDAPSSGKASDLARGLMMEWDRTTGGNRFAEALARRKLDGMRMLDEWRQVAIANFLGILHIDEVQNFFKLSTLEQRRKRTSGSAAPQLSIVEDQCIKWILTLMNTWQIPLLLSGTPDGINAITKRLSNLERIVTSGYHPFTNFQSAKDPAYREMFLSTLGRFQYVRNKLPIDDGLADLVLELTGGVQRLIIALWIAAHRIAFERTSDDLRLEDFRVAAKTYLAPLAPAVAALRGNQPDRMARYEDLIPRDSSYWSNFWDLAP
jgi:hypothetical protein